MADYLTERLAEIPGVAGPYTPDYADPVHFMYVIEFRPEELELDVTVEALKSAAWRALEAEGVSILQWQREIIPAMRFFQDDAGYRRACPWRCCGSEVTYNPDDYPEAQRFVASHAYLRGVFPPNGMELVNLYVEAFGKVFSQIGTVVC